MAYTALYRKFRPVTFEEIVGQEHITKTLRNQIVANRVGHAYLFNGGRGTGKTSAAKILARAINCLNPKDGEPCNECEICKEALTGSLTDIVEMDAASNNSVEDVRQIRDEVNFLPTKAKYRVYIIDEVHMLSTGAFNALLKTLEEPPEHVKFILATTEPQKLPATILSRCQRFDFKKISEANIVKRLEIVCKESNIDITEDALNIISHLAEGAMRDALSILERCAQDEDGKIDEAKVKDLVGIPKLTYISNLTKNIVNNNEEEALRTIEEVITEGKDLQNLLWELIKYVKDILVFKSGSKLSVYSKEELQEIEEISNKVDKSKLLNIIYELSNLSNDMKLSTQKIILFQVGIIKLCSNEAVSSNGYAISDGSIDDGEVRELKQRIANLENEIRVIKNSGTAINRPAQNVENYSQKVTPSARKMEIKAEPIKQEVPQYKPTGKGVGAWPQIIDSMKQDGKIMLYTNLINSRAEEINDMTIGISFPKGLTPFGKTVLEKSENIVEIERKVSMEFGKPMKIKYIDGTKQSEQATEVNPIESFSQDNDIPFNIVD
ncbi:MAG: DNA polymerase III subunit gamma/tau [Clostridia bacterium]|nr:DNA polymerase III subunit gamma/tau [Clostridia bacterium]